jgi:anti-sigma B factor antagonist
MLGRTYTEFEGSTAAELQSSIREHKARPGGRVVGPITVGWFIRDQLRRRELSLTLSNDHRYRYKTAGLTIDVEELRNAPAAILHCTGQITAANAHLLKSKAAYLLDGRITRLMLNMEHVSFMDSAGIGAIVSAQRRARAIGGDLTLCALSKEVALTLRLVHLDKVLHIYTTLPEGLTACNAVKASHI